MTYNKSEIMKRAWALYNGAGNNGYLGKTKTFAQCLSTVWSEVKIEKNSVKASDLVIGDVISFRYGVRPDECVTSTVKSVTEIDVWGTAHLSIIAVRASGHEDNICVKPSDMIYVAKHASAEIARKAVKQAA